MALPSVFAQLSDLPDRLKPPAGRVRVILDTDTFNEVDDQFAVVHALLAPEKLQIEAINAAPFANARSTGPGDGMEKSHAEILRLLERLDRPASGLVFAGARSFLPEAATPVDSPATRRIMACARAGNGPLYVVSIGAPTNVASALLLDPGIAERIVVVWLGSHGSGQELTDEFNFRQDLHASRILLDCGVPLVLLPCRGVVSHMITTTHELEHYLGGGAPVATFLLERVRAYGEGHPPAWSKVIWDLAATAWLINPAWLPSELVPSPQFNDDFSWRPTDPARHPIRRVRFVHRDAIFGDFFARLDRQSASLPRRPAS